MFSLILAPSVFRGSGSGNSSICGAGYPSWNAADPWGSGTGFWRVYLCGLKHCRVQLCCGHATGGRWEQDLSCITRWYYINITVQFIRNSFILCGLLFIELTVAVFLLLFQNFEAYVVHSMNQNPWTELSDFNHNTPISPWASKPQVEMFPRSVAACEIWRAKFVFNLIFGNVSLTGLLTAPDRIFRHPVAHGQFMNMLQKRIITLYRTCLKGKMCHLCATSIIKCNLTNIMI